MIEVDPQKLQYIRQKRGKSQDDLANYLNVSGQMVSIWERGGKPVSPKHHDKICEILGVTINKISKPVPSSKVIFHEDPKDFPIADAIILNEHWKSLIANYQDGIPEEDGGREYLDFIKSQIKRTNDEIDEYYKSGKCEYPRRNPIIITQYVKSAIDNVYKNIFKSDLSKFRKLTHIDMEKIRVNKTNTIPFMTWEKLLPYVMVFLSGENRDYYLHFELRDICKSEQLWGRLSRYIYYDLPIEISSRFIDREENLRTVSMNRMDMIEKMFNEPQHEVEPVGKLNEWPVISFAQAAGFDPTLEPIDDFCKDCSDEVEEFAMEKKDGYFALKVVGDSMSPFMPDGSIVAVAGGEFPQRGDVVVAKIRESGQVVVKRYERKDNKIKLSSVNPGGEEFEWNCKEQKGFVEWMYPALECKINLRKQRWENRLKGNGDLALHGFIAIDILVSITFGFFVLSWTNYNIDNIINTLTFYANEILFSLATLHGLVCATFVMCVVLASRKVVREITITQELISHKNTIQK